MTQYKRLLPVLLIILLSFSLNGCSQETEKERQLLNMADEILSDVSKMVGQESTRKVKKGFKDKDELIAILDKMMEEEYPENEFYAYEKALKFMRLIPQDMNLLEKIKSFYLEQIGGFYDPDAKELYLIRAGQIPMLDNPMVQKMLMAHELTHALQDMKVDLNKMLRDAPSDDHTIARLSIAEGQAVLVMFMYVMKMPADKVPDLAAMRPMMTSGSGGMMGASFEEFENAPRYLKETLALFPYLDGAIFYQKYLKQFPDRKQIEIFDHLPSSSEQILHFDKYLENDLPQLISIDKPENLLGQAWTMLLNQSLGEIDWRLMFEETGIKKSAVRDAEGWDGTEIFIYENKQTKDTAGLIISTWDSKRDMMEAAENYRELLMNKYPDAKEEFNKDYINFHNGEYLSQIIMKDNDLIVIENIPVTLIDQVRENALKYTKIESK
ncbi:MAG: hypothetical protein JW737_03820 [Acidobacteria bacterium]|nr:hypothetical protein [Acidobacteriota bacterium]